MTQPPLLRHGLIAAFAGALGALALAGLAAAEPAARDTEPPTPRSSIAWQALPYRLALPQLVRDGSSPQAQGAFRTAATALVSPGRVSIDATVTSDRTTEALLQIEVYDALGRRVHVHGEDHLYFGANQPRVFHTQWSTAGAQPGPYVVRLGLWAPGAGWETLLHWNNDAVSFTLP